MEQGRLRRKPAFAQSYGVAGAEHSLPGVAGTPNASAE